MPQSTSMSTSDDLSTPHGSLTSSSSQSLLHAVLDDVIDATSLGRSALLHASLQGHHAVLQYLLYRINSREATACTDQLELDKALSAAFLGAAGHGHVHCLSALLESGTSSSSLHMHELLAAEDPNGATALILAASKGHSDCIVRLLQHNPAAQVAAANYQGSTALISAACRGHADCLAHLLQHNPQAQVAATDNCGDTALMVAAHKGRADCVKLLLQHDSEAQVAAAGGEDGSTALMVAVYLGHVDCVAHLLQHCPEAQVAAVNSFGDTALMLATQRGHADCIALLLAHTPADQIAAENPNIEGRCALEIAARLGHPQCLDLLLAHHPQQHQLDQAWLSALGPWNGVLCAQSPRTQCLEQLVAKGAMLPSGADEAAKTKTRVVIQDLAARALVADRTNAAIVGLALTVRSKKRKASEAE